MGRPAWAAFMVRTFAFHIGVGLAVLAAACLALHARRVSLAIGCVSLAVLTPSLAGLMPRAQAADGRPTLTVLSVNLLYGRADATRLAREIERVQPDVIAFQEYTRDSAGALVDLLGPSFPHRYEHARDDAFGQAVYSRLPFTAQPRAFPADPSGPWNDPQICATVEFAGYAVAVMNIHLVPPTSAEWFTRQRRDTARLAALAARELSAGGTMIIAGDFNAVPQSRNLAAMRMAGMNDAFAEAGSGRGSTWPRTSWLKILPGVRIDHVLHGSRLECIDAGVCGDIGSDHRPTWARFVAR